jgi:hypothetical protein
MVVLYKINHEIYQANMCFITIPERGMECQSFRLRHSIFPMTARLEVVASHNRS